MVEQLDSLTVTNRSLSFHALALCFPFLVFLFIQFCLTFPGSCISGVPVRSRWRNLSSTLLTFSSHFLFFPKCLHSLSFHALSLSFPILWFPFFRLSFAFPWSCISMVPMRSRWRKAGCWGDYGIYVEVDGAKHNQGLKSRHCSSAYAQRNVYNIHILCRQCSDIEYCVVL